MLTQTLTAGPDVLPGPPEQARVKTHSGKDGPGGHGGAAAHRVLPPVPLPSPLTAPSSSARLSHPMSPRLVPDPRLGIRP